MDVVLPASGQMNEYKFDLSANGAIYNVEAHVYANDFNGLVAAINATYFCVRYNCGGIFS